MIRWRPGDPVPVPVRRAVPDPGPGRAVLYVDERTGEPMVATHRGARQRLAEPMRAPSPPSAWAGTASVTLSLDSLVGGIVTASVPLAAARPGMLAVVSYGAQIPDQIAGAPFARVTTAGSVLVSVPLGATLSTVSVPVLVAVAAI